MASHNSNIFHHFSALAAIGAIGEVGGEGHKQNSLKVGNGLTNSSANAGAFVLSPLRTAQEATMAKGEQRSNKEKKKPKAAKPAASNASAPSQKGKFSASNLPGKKPQY